MQKLNYYKKQCFQTEENSKIIYLSKSGDRTLQVNDILSKRRYNGKINYVNKATAAILKTMEWWECFLRITEVDNCSETRTNVGGTEKFRSSYECIAK